MNWDKLTTKEQLDHIVEESKTKPVVIFKHSTTCSISATALDRFERKGKDKATESQKYYYLDLKSFREVSNEIADRFKVQHESPQVLVIKEGEAVMNASHYDISFDEVSQIA